MSWYSEWFGEEYLLLYAHRDEAEAQKQVEFVCDRVLSKDSSRILDIACGQGRHLLEFTKRSHDALGIDLSSSLLSRAIRPQDGLQRLLRADMRQLPFRSGVFNLLSSFFTSFGYFESDAEHLELLREWKRVSRKEGILFLDYLNPPQVVSGLTPESVDEHQGHIVRQSRRISSDGKRVEKDIVITCKENGRETTFSESVRMYPLEELSALLEDAGYQVLETFGDFDGTEYGEDSPRLLLSAKAKTQ